MEQEQLQQQERATILALTGTRGDRHGSGG